MKIDITQIRRATPKDAAALAAIHEESWRSTYQGIIPHLHLERTIARRGPVYWRRSLESGADILIFLFDGHPQGYASIGRARSNRPWAAGEIFELYLTPSYQGIGFGKRLFLAARQALERQGCQGLIVWALKDNETACAFYARQGGKPVATAPERYGKTALQRIAFAWKPRRRI